MRMPFVIGAVIDLGNCLDLLLRENLQLLGLAYEAFSRLREAAGLPLPENRDAARAPTVATSCCASAIAPSSGSSMP